ncbi:uncharacterized protein LOC134280965 [Saccostrea cucullata]|uniref:uncharacterized protein LOC134280965 n=1 Tax=Saccostrea cuccullata TaxID=36930 RepID=UPI002ED3C081
METIKKEMESTLQTTAYFGSLLSVQTTKGLFVDELLDAEVHKDFTEFNLSSLHRTTYMSKNKKILSNINFPLAVSGSGEGTLQRYEGAKVDKINIGVRRIQNEIYRAVRYQKDLQRI